MPYPFGYIIDFKEHRDVEYYASILNLTPKYMSGLVKSASGKPALQWIEEKIIIYAKAPEEINRFLIENGYVEGEIEPLPPYSDSHPVTDEEAAVFHAACDSYSLPLGTPVSVAKRNTSTSVDYKFDVESKAANGDKTNAVIYVTVSDSIGAVPEFTQVVR